jgi:type I restriction enzyme S subunit
MTWQPTRLAEFLHEREGRIKYEVANMMGLQRIKKIDFSGAVHLEDETDTKTDMILVKNGDLVISGINAAKGAIAVYEEDEDVLATVHYSSYEFNSDRISVDFLKWFFKSPEFSDLLKAQVPGGIKTELKPKHLLPLKIKIPDLSEQITIAEHLNRISFKQAKLEHEISRQEAFLVRLWQAIMADAAKGTLTNDWRAQNTAAESVADLLSQIERRKAQILIEKKLRADKPLPPISPEEIPFEIPPTWAWVRYGDLCEFVTSGSRGWQQFYSDSGALFIRAQNIKTDRLSLADQAFVNLPNKTEGLRAKVAKGDILVTITGSNLAKTALVEEEFKEAYVSQHIALTRPVEPNLGRWLHQQLTTDHGSRRTLLGYSKGDKPGLNLPNVRSVPVPIPPLEEQQIILDRVEGLMEYCTALKKEIAISRTYTEKVMEAALGEAFALAA